MAKKDMDSGGRWFAEISSVHETGALSANQITESLAEYIALYGEDIGTAQFEQEYLCSFNAAILGAFYGREMAKVRAEGRIDPAIESVAGEPVHRAWDIGVRDDTSIRSEEHTSELQSLMRISYAVFCLKNKRHNKNTTI